MSNITAENIQHRVVCAMSGGVDSSVAAALLCEQGHEVIGVTLQVWPSNTDNERACCSLSAVEDARRVATKLGIPYYVINVQEAFRASVIAPFIDAYRRGETPNPCIACNRWIKYDLLLQKARELGATHLATGHYARILRDPLSQRWHLRRGADARKDQTYVLYAMTQDQLAHTLFPLGETVKTDTRKIAQSLGLTVAAKPDSQEICFIPENDYRAFLREQVPEAFAPGAMVDTNGTRLGTHDGVLNFTIGQRKGLGISTGDPRFVIALDAPANRVVVGTGDHLLRRTLIAGDVVFGKLDEVALREPRRVTVKIRSNMVAQPGVAYLADGKLRVTFDAPQRAIVPGQAVVCYDADDVAAGGTITDSTK